MMKKIPIDYKNCTLNDLIEVLYFIQMELVNRNIKSVVKLNTLVQKFVKRA